MKRRIFLSILGLSVLVLPALAWAQALVIVPREQTLAGNVFRMGERIDIDGTVEGDVILIGGDVTIAGTVGGDAIVLAQSLTISGTVTGSVRAAARDLLLKGPVGRNVTVAGQAVRLEDNASVGGSLAVAASDLNSRATVSGSLDAIVQTANVGGHIGKNVTLRSGLRTPRVRGGATVISRGAVIDGALLHTGEQAVFVEDGATVSGGVTEHALKTTETLPPFFRLLGQLTSLFGLLLVGYVFLAFFPRPFGTVVGVMRRWSLRSLLSGLAVLLIVPPVSVFLVLTIIGAPLGLMLIGFYLLGLYLGRVAAALAIGVLIAAAFKQRQIRFPQSPWLIFTAGAVAVSLTVNLLLGWSQHPTLLALQRLVSSGLMLWGFGGLITAIWLRLRTKPKPHH